MGFDDQHIIDEATAALPDIVAALDSKSQPATGAWVAFAVYGRSEGDERPPVIHRAWYTWHRHGPLDEIDEATYEELTLDPETGKVKVPVWAFDLEPPGSDEWRLGHWFGAPLRMWLGEKAGDRVKGYGVSFHAYREDNCWQVAFNDILAM